MRGVEKNDLIVGLKSNYEFSAKSMKVYDITDKIREVLKKYDFFNKVKNTNYGY